MRRNASASRIAGVNERADVMAVNRLPPVFKAALGGFDDEPTPVTNTRPPPLPLLEVPPLIVAAPALQIRRIPASPRNYGHVERVPRLIVVHCTDGHEGPSKDGDVAAMFTDPELKPRRSSHYVVDTDSVTQCVPDNLEAWHCGRTGNHRGIGIELCGLASQSYAQWHDSNSLPMLQIAARLIAELCKRHNIPAVYLSSPDLKADRPGITTHSSVSLAWGESNHTDPGPGFPMVKLVSAVRVALGLPQ